ncbi:MAG: glycosyltransferase, partial [Fimbriiglobus sp.]
MTPPVPRPVNVCFLIDRLSRAGTETQLLALIRELDRARVRPALVLLDGDDALSHELEPTDCPVLRLGVKRLVGTGAARAAGRLRAFWRAHATDVLQVYFLDSAYFGVPLAKLAGVPRVVRVRNNLGYWLTPKHRVLNRIVGRLADVTLTNTDAGKDAIVRGERLPAGRVTVIPNGVDLARFAAIPPPFAAADIVVGCVANLRPVKNIDGLMRAAAVVCNRLPHVRFAVAGDG